MNEIGKKVLLSVGVAVISILSTYFVITNFNQETPKEEIDCKTQIADLEKSIEQYKKDIDSYKTQISNYESDIEEKETEISNLNLQISDSKDTIKEYENDITSKNNEISTLENEIKDYKEDIKDLEDTINSITDDKTIKKLKEQVTTLTNKVETNETKIEELKSEVSTLESKKMELETSVSTLTSKVAELENENKELKNKITELNNLITTYENTIKEKNNEIIELENEIAINENTIKEKDKTIAGLEKSLSISESIIKDVRKEVYATSINSVREYVEAIKNRTPSIKFETDIYRFEIEDQTIDYDLTINSNGYYVTRLPIKKIKNADVVIRGTEVEVSKTFPGQITFVSEVELEGNATLEIRGGSFFNGVHVTNGTKFIHTHGIYSGEIRNEKGGYVELNISGTKVRNDSTLILDAAYNANINQINGTLIFRDQIRDDSKGYGSSEDECIGYINWNGGIIDLSELPDNGKLEITIDGTKSKDDLKLNTNTKIYDESGNDITSSETFTDKIYVNHKK